MTVESPAIDWVHTVARQLGELRDEVVFLGGATVGLLGRADNPLFSGTSWQAGTGLVDSFSLGEIVLEAKRIVAG